MYIAVVINLNVKMKKSYTITKHNVGTWKEHMWQTSPAKMQQLEVQENYIRQIENNLLFVLKVRGSNKTKFVKWMRDNKVNASRYLFKQRGFFLPFVTLIDVLMISRYLEIDAQKLIFEDFNEKYPQINPQNNE